MSNQEARSVNRVAVIGTGVIGASWCALFLAADLEVAAYDPEPNANERLRNYIARAWPTLRDLGLTERDAPGAYQFHMTARDAVRNAEFVQESVPERIDIKHALYRDIEDSLAPHAVVASSASGLLVKDMQLGFKNPSRFILGHPFNPPHLIPLVELLVNELTEEGVLEIAESFYQQVGKITIRVKKEVPAHVANRLQAALWREAISLVLDNVASVEDVDKAIWSGPGLRWAAMGPHMLFNLAAGSGGMDAFCDRYRDSFHHWWHDLGSVELNPENAQVIADGVREAAGSKSLDDLAAERDAMIVAMLRATKDKR